MHSPFLRVGGERLGSVKGSRCYPIEDPTMGVPVIFMISMFLGVASVGLLAFTLLMIILGKVDV